MEHHKLAFWSVIENYFDIWHHKMQDTRNKCFLSKKRSTTFFQVKIGKHKYVAVIILHSSFPIFEGRKVALCFFYPKQLLVVSCILRCYFSKWFLFTINTWKMFLISLCVVLSVVNFPSSLSPFLYNFKREFALYFFSKSVIYFFKLVKFAFKSVY